MAEPSHIAGWREARRRDGVVYRVVDLKLDHPVALKFLPEQFAHDEAATRRFVQEAKAASLLDHSNISMVYKIARPKTDIVMPFYDGETLKQKIADRSRWQTPWTGRFRSTDSIARHRRLIRSSDS